MGESPCGIHCAIRHVLAACVTGLLGGEKRTVDPKPWLVQVRQLDHPLSHCRRHGCVRKVVVVGTLLDLNRRNLDLEAATRSESCQRPEQVDSVGTVVMTVGAHAPEHRDLLVGILGVAIVPCFHDVICASIDDELAPSALPTVLENLSKGGPWQHQQQERNQRGRLAATCGLFACCERRWRLTVFARRRRGRRLPCALLGRLAFCQPLFGCTPLGVRLRRCVTFKFGFPSAAIGEEQGEGNRMSSSEDKFGKTKESAIARRR